MMMKRFLAFGFLICAPLAFADTGVHDPTEPLDWAKQAHAPPENLKLGGIIQDAQGIRAFVDQQWVRAGDNVSNYQVIDITPEQVQLSNDKGSYVLLLGAPVRKEN